MDSMDRDKHGRFQEQVSAEEVLSVFNNEPKTAGEIAEMFNITNRAALNKLEELNEQGELGRKKVGARAVVWWKTTGPKSH